MAFLRHLLLQRAIQLRLEVYFNLPWRARRATFPGLSGIHGGTLRLRSQAGGLLWKSRWQAQRRHRIAPLPNRPTMEGVRGRSRLIVDVGPRTRCMIPGPCGTYVGFGATFLVRPPRVRSAPQGPCCPTPSALGGPTFNTPANCLRALTGLPRPTDRATSADLARGATETCGGIQAGPTRPMVAQPDRCRAGFYGTGTGQMGPRGLEPRTSSLSATRSAN